MKYLKKPIPPKKYWWIDITDRLEKDDCIVKGLYHDCDLYDLYIDLNMFETIQELCKYFEKIDNLENLQLKIQHGDIYLFKKCELDDKSFDRDWKEYEKKLYEYERWKNSQDKASLLQHMKKLEERFKIEKEKFEDTMKELREKYNEKDVNS